MSFLYREAGRVLKGVEDGRASLKTLTFKANNNVGGGKGGDRDGPKRKVSRLTIKYCSLYTVQVELQQCCGSTLRASLPVCVGVNAYYLIGNRLNRKHPVSSMS